MKTAVCPPSLFHGTTPPVIVAPRSNDGPIQRKRLRLPRRLEASINALSEKHQPIQAMWAGGDLGFAGRKLPTGYGSVSLQASINGIALGDAWSQKTTYAESTEHAEDAVIDYVQQCAYAIGMQGYPSFVTPTMKKVIDSMATSAKMNLVISNLTASPCSDKRGTNKKTDAAGCTERLIKLKEDLEKQNYTVSITVNADHYYQPQGVVNAKAQSKKAADDLKAAKIAVNIANP